MPAIEICEASLAQADALAAIHAASFNAGAWSVAQIEGSLALNTTRGWVANQNGKALGFILCQTRTDQAEILTFAVHPSAQRQSLGEKLLEEALRGVGQAGALILFLEVAADNEPARRLYKKLGFHETGGRPNYYQRNGGAVDAVFYERALSSRAEEGFSTTSQKGLKGA